MSIWKRIKNLWYISGVDLKPNKAISKDRVNVQKLLFTLGGKKMAKIVETKNKEDLFPNEQNDERDLN